MPHPPQRRRGRLFLGILILGIIGWVLIRFTGSRFESDGPPQKRPLVTTTDSLAAGVHNLKYICRRGVIDTALTRIDARVEDRDVEAAKSEFGYLQTELNEQLVRRVERRLEKMGYRGFSVVVVGDDIEYTVPRVFSEYETERIRSSVHLAISKARHDFLIRHGLTYVPVLNDFTIDYADIQMRNTRRVADLSRSLEAHASRMAADPRQRLEIFLRFVQGLPYAMPPQTDGLRTIHTFWTPPEVAIKGRGDCDSKTILFATLWSREHPDQLIAVYTPEHLFLGVRGFHARSSRETVWRVGGIDYLLCETTGFGWRPGEIPRRNARWVKRGKAHAVQLH